MRILEKDILILRLLDKLRCLDAHTIARLCGYYSHHKAANRMADLVKEGYVKVERLSTNSRNYYVISRKGMNVLYPRKEVISKNGLKYVKYPQPPNFSVTHYRHEIITANILAHILKCNPELTIDDFKSDREMQGKTSDDKKYIRHYCDLLCEKYKVKVEIELTLKKYSVIQENIALNGDDYMQLWITDTNAVYNSLTKLKDEMPYFSIEIVKLEDFENTNIKFSELHKKLLENNPRLF